MRIVDCPESSLPPPAQRADALNAALPVEIASEHGMDLYIDGRFTLRMVCTPEHLAELTAGRLITEGWARRKEDIQSIEVSGGGLRADVTLVKGPAAPEDTPPVTPRPWKESWLRRAAERMREEEPLYARTHAAHACYLGCGDELLCCREDIGRHNALDKAVGYALLEGIDRKNCYLFTTGRMPTDMVLKAVRASIPLLASKTYPTAEGVALARRARLTLVTLRPGGSLLIWADGALKDEEACP